MKQFSLYKLLLLAICEQVTLALLTNDESAYSAVSLVLGFGVSAGMNANDKKRDRVSTNEARWPIAHQDVSK